MEWLDSLGGIAKVGTPIVAILSLLGSVAGVYYRELRRHHAREMLTLQTSCEQSMLQLRAQYDELLARHNRLGEKCDAVTEKYYATEREFSTFIRTVTTAAEKAGTP